MTIITESRGSDSPYVESIMRGWTVGTGSAVRPAELSWHMVFSKHGGRVYPLAVGPWTESGGVNYGDGAEILWIRFRLGTFMPHLSTRKLLDAETALPDASGRAFWLGGAAWQFPNYENADTFIARLFHDGILVCDPLVSDTLKNQRPPRDVSPRTVRHRFLQSTGVTQSHIFQVERAQQAAAMLRQGVSILDTIHEAGYYDQPHLTRALKRFVGMTPAQLVRIPQAV